MPLVPLSSRLFSGLLAGGLALACSAYAADSARAGVIEQRPDGSLLFEAAPDEENKLRIMQSGDRLQIYDDAAAIEAGPGCQQWPYMVECPFADRAVINLGDRDDSFRLDWGVSFAELEVNGGAGNDDLEGGTLVHAGDGDDEIWGGDVVYGGAGDDRIQSSREAYGEAGQDALVMGGEAGEVADGGAGDDKITPRFNSANDAVSTLYRGGAGTDELRFDGVSDSAPISITLDGRANDGAAGMTDNVGDDIEKIIGGVGDDTLDASAGSQSSGYELVGFGGNDTITGSAFNDRILGGGGGWLGNDGDDVLTGGAGADIFNDNARPASRGRDTINCDFADYQGSANYAPWEQRNALTCKPWLPGQPVITGVSREGLHEGDEVVFTGHRLTCEDPWLMNISTADPWDPWSYSPFRYGPPQLTVVSATPTQITARAGARTGPTDPFEVRIECRSSLSLGEVVRESEPVALHYENIPPVAVISAKRLAKNPRAFRLEPYKKSHDPDGWVPICDDCEERLKPLYPINWEVKKGRKWKSFVKTASLPNSDEVARMLKRRPIAGVRLTGNGLTNEELANPRLLFLGKKRNPRLIRLTIEDRDGATATIVKKLKPGKARNHKRMQNRKRRGGGRR